MDQAALGGLALFHLRSLEEVLLARAARMAAIGSTVFALLITPRSPAAPRHLLGGHLLSLAVGTGEGALLSTGLGSDALEGPPLLFDLGAATDTEHAPAAGTALGMALHTPSWGVLAFLVSSLPGLALLRRLVRRRLQDLTQVKPLSWT